MGLASKKKICCNKKGKIFVEKWVYVNDNLPAICKTLPFINRDLICLWIKRIYPLRKAYHQFIEDILTQARYQRSRDHPWNSIPTTTILTQFSSMSRSNYCTLIMTAFLFNLRFSYYSPTEWNMATFQFFD